MPGKFGGDSDSLERAMESLAESLDRLASNIEFSNRQGALGGGGGIGGAGGGRGGRVAASGGIGLAGRAAAVAGGFAASKAAGFATSSLKAGAASFSLSRGSVGFEGAVLNGSIAALRQLPGGSAVVDRRLGPAERAISRARGVVEPILRAGGLQGKGDLAKVSNALIDRFEPQEKRVQEGRDLFQKRLQEKTRDQAGNITNDFVDLGRELGKGFIEYVSKNPDKAARASFGIGGFVIPKFGGK